MSASLRRLVLPLALLLAPSAALGATVVKEYEVTGQSRGKDGKPGAEKPAEDDALKAAVERGVVELAGAKVLEEKKEELKKILAKGRRYIPEFRVVDRSEAGATAVVKMRAKVNLTALESDLIAAGILAPAESTSVVLTRVVILPAAAKGGGAPWWAEGGAPGAPDPLTTVMIETLRARGFDVVEARRPEPDPDAPVPMPKPPPADPTDENLLTVARFRDGDVAVRVPWEVQVNPRALDGITYALARAKLGPVEALATKDGRVVATVSGEGVAGEPLDAARAALGKVPAEVSERVSNDAIRAAAVDAAARLATALGDPTAKGGTAANLKLVVAGLDSWVTYDRFERALQRDLKSVRQAVLHSIERGEATFDLSLQRGISAEAFAEEMEKKPFEQFSVKVTEKTAERVVLHLSR